MAEASMKGPPILEVDLHHAKELVKNCGIAKHTVNLVSSPGVGKSAICREVARDWHLKYIDIRLTEYDPTELNGYPFILNPKEEWHLVKAGHVPMVTFPTEHDPLPDGCQGWMIMLDEFPSAPLSVQAAAYKITLDRMVGNNKLHDNVIITTAGNKATDKALVNRLSTAQQSRFSTLWIKVVYKIWREWAKRENATKWGPIDYRVTSFLHWKTDLLHKFDPDHADLTFPCPRTWEFISNLCHANKWEKIEYSKLPLLAGTVGHAAARQFYAFAEIFQDLPTIEKIIADPLGCTLSQEISVHHAAAGLVGKHINKDNAKPLFQFLSRLPADLQTVTLREAIAANDSLRTVPELLQWASQNSKELIA
jgi:hypothetical protein